MFGSMVVMVLLGLWLSVTGLAVVAGLVILVVLVYWFLVGVASFIDMVTRKR